MFTRRIAINQYFCLRPAARQRANPFQSSVQMMASAIQAGPIFKREAILFIDSMLDIILYFIHAINGYRLWFEEGRHSIYR